MLGVIGIILTVEIIPPANQYKNCVISGSIDPSEKIVGNKPNYVYIYYPFHIPKYLCRSSDIRLSAIEWGDENKGKYQILFTVPVGLDEVIITTDCSSCEHKKVNLDEIPKSVDLVWGSAKCEDDFQVSNQQSKAIEHARNFLNGIETNIVDKPFNTSEVQSIKKDVERGRDEISESDRIRSNINESLLHAYYVEWFAWRAQYKLKLFELKYCVNKVNLLVKTHENDKCFVPDHNAYNDYNSANSTYFSLSDSRLLNDYPFDIKELDEMKKEIDYVNRQVKWVSDSLRECEDSYRIINGTFEFQKPYCETRQIIFKITYIIWAIVFVYLGILIEKGRKIWKK
ncbi:MAG: hypothetical protein U9R43_00180 [Thermodesulfobacteriota bacterium]|nr:hypothetical protein [Thermodesulfobacteriota bacterium]